MIFRCEAIYTPQLNGSYTKMQQLVVKILVILSVARNCSKIILIDMYWLIYEYST